MDSLGEGRVKGVVELRVGGSGIGLRTGVGGCISTFFCSVATGLGVSAGDGWLLASGTRLTEGMGTGSEGISRSGREISGGADGSWILSTKGV